MNEIETEYRGYTIRYSENQDVWRCHALDMDGVTLTQLKNKIGRYLAKIAKTSETIPAFRVEYGDHFTPCFIVSVANTLNYQKQPQLWTYKERNETYRGGARVVKDRAKYDASSVVLDTPENQALIEKATALIAASREAKKVADAAVAAIPRVDVSTISAEEPDASA